MSLLDTLLQGGNIVKTVADKVSEYLPSETQKREWEAEAIKSEREYSLEVAKVLQSADESQNKVNVIEAANPSLFIAGWRPMIGWIGAVALAYQFIVYPVLTWFPVLTVPKPLDANLLWTIITGMLGIGTMRSFDKWQGVDTKGMGK